MNILKLEKRGMDFRADDERVAGSDIGNYRVCTPSDLPVLARDGRVYWLEFTRATKYAYRKTHKITGKPLKHAIRETVTENAAHLSASFTGEDGFTYGDLALWRDAWENARPYTEAGILELVNRFSALRYDAIAFV
jgi:hypothetical protein